MTKEEYQAKLKKQLEAVDALPDGCDIISGRICSFGGSSILLLNRYHLPPAEHSASIHGPDGDYMVFSTSVCGVRVEWNTAGVGQ